METLSLGLAIPEIMLAIGAMALLMLGVYTKGNALRLVSMASVVLLFAAAIAAAATNGGGPQTTFSGMFIVDGFSGFSKVLILIAAALAIVVSVDYLERENLRRFEYPVLVVLATLGMLMMVSANDLISLYLGIELQSLALYVLAAISRDSVRATEAGLKYFVLGALSSGMLLYGCSLIYGYTGATGFPEIAAAASAGDTSVGLLFGLVFLFAGLAFKVSAVPFHMWTPDVYEGAPTSVTAFFAVAPKVAAMALFVRAALDPFPEIAGQWQQIIIFLSIASMFVGAVFALVQTNIKRLMAYSSIGHVGYALVGLAAAGYVGSDQLEVRTAGIESILIYLTIYLIMNVGAFALILSMRRGDGATEDISDLAGLSTTRPGMAAALAVFMFSLAGIPPLAGFFGKFYVFVAAVDAGLIPLAIIGVLTSVIGAFYYLRIVKLMYFDEPVAGADVQPGGTVRLVASVSAIATIAFVIFANPIIRAAENAAASLFS